MVKIIEFDWDEGNRTKNLIKHQVEDYECEEVFFNKPKTNRKDRKHSKSEPRYSILGRTDKGRLLAIAYTIRKNKIRVISARDMTERERQKYEQIKKNTRV